MIKKDILIKMNDFQKKTMTDHIGIEIIDYGEEYITAKMPIDNRTKQPFGIMHGGASAVLAESLGSIGAGMSVDMKTKSVVGIELNVSHLKAVKGGWVFGTANAIRIGNKIQVWSIDITDERKNKVCIGRLTLAIIDKK